MRQSAVRTTSLLLAGMVVAGLGIASTAAAAPRSAPGLSAVPDRVSLHAQTPPGDPYRISPQTSGGNMPSGTLMPTGPATAGPRPGTLSVGVGPDKLVCDEPADPYGGATTQIVYTTPGVTVRKYSKDGRTPLFVTKANVGDTGAKVRPGPLVRGGVSTLQTLRDKFTGSGAYTATNGDFFDYGRTGAPWGPEITRGTTVWSGRSAKQTALILQRNATATIGHIWLSIPIEAPKLTLHAASFNSFVLPTDGIGVFTDLWGSGKRTYIQHSQPAREYIVQNGVVTAVHTSITNDPVPAGGLILLAQGDGIGRLSYAGVVKGARVSASASPQTDAPYGIDSAIGVGMSLVAGGKYQGPVCSKDNAVARTAVGIMNGGKTMIVAVVQGQTDAAHSDFSGMTAQETTSLMKHLGATDAVMFDGGGSANIMTAKTGQLTRSPDGWDRAIPNGYAFWKK